jgi:hypothetical protein
VFWYNADVINPDGSKTCPRCTLSLPTDRFYRIARKGGRDGFGGYCKLCTKAKAVDWQKANPDKMKAKWAADSAKLSERARLGQLTLAEVEHHNARGARWRKKHPEKARAIHKECVRKRREKDPFTFRAKRAIHNNKRRAKDKNVPSDFTIGDWQAVLAVFNLSCAFCKSTTRFLDLEHLFPLHLGGYNVVGNIVPACRPCNGHKSCLPPEKFAAEMGVDLAEIQRLCRVRESELPPTAT